MSLITLSLFWSCIKTYSIKGNTFVEGMGFYSIILNWIGANLFFGIGNLRIIQRLLNKVYALEQEC